MPIELISLSAISFDSTTQAREGLNKEVCEEYRDILKDDPNALPMPDVFWDEESQSYYIGDGWHRLEAHRLLGKDSAHCAVHEGGRLEAIRMAVGANDKHGLRRTNEDKRRAVELAARTWPKLSARELARRCGVSHNFANDAKNRVSSDDTKGQKGGDSPSALVLAIKDPEEREKVKTAAFHIAQKNGRKQPNDADLKEAYETWLAEQEAAAKKQVPDDEPTDLAEFLTHAKVGVQGMSKASPAKGRRDAWEELLKEVQAHCEHFTISWETKK